MRRPRPRTGHDARPAFLQSAFVIAYSAAWIVAGVNFSAFGGRLERPLAVVGLLAIPLAASRNRSASLCPPAPVIWGMAGLLGTYGLSFLLNGPDAYGATFVIALASRVAFLWIGFVLLQSRRLLSTSMRLLMGSSILAALVAVWQMRRLGIGVGRLAGLELDDLMGNWMSVVFYSAQAATVGAILLFGVASSGARSRRVWYVVLAGMIFGVAYMSYFRREFLITVPLVLAVLWSSGVKVDRRSATVLLAIFLSLVAWEASRPKSILLTRLRYETGGFVNPHETRVVTGLAQLSAIREEPLLGHGPGHHRLAIAPYVPLTERYLSGFNVYGWLAVEGGVGCLLSYLVILISAFSVAWRRRRTPDRSAEMIWLHCGPALVAQIALWGVFGNSWENSLAWFVLGGIFAADRLADEARWSMQPVLSERGSGRPRSAWPVPAHGPVARLADGEFVSHSAPAVWSTHLPPAMRSSRELR